MGEVWRGRDTVLGRPVAVKLLKPEYADDALFRQRFEIEAQHAASLHHPGIAGVFDFGEAPPLDGSATPRPYLVMELVEGQPLSDLLRPSAPMDPEVTQDLMAQTADALGAAHRAGIVHRDVKPGNLIVTPDRRIKVTDFGIARAAEGLALTETGQVMGTPAYLSPEQAEGGTATAASDVYSLGVVAYECLVGRRPFVADTAVATALAHLRQPVPELPPTSPLHWRRSWPGHCPRTLPSGMPTRRPSPPRCVIRRPPPAPQPRRRRSWHPLSRRRHRPRSWQPPRQRWRRPRNRVPRRRAVARGVRAGCPGHCSQRSSWPACSSSGS
jgi:serine/threonine protein kinase